MRWRLRFDNVGFSYPSRPAARVLQGLSFDVEEGTVVGIMGSTGAGKSTLFALIQRLFDPDKGRITLDGRDLSSYDAVWLRRNIASVEQEPMLFDRSVKENLLYGCVPISQSFDAGTDVGATVRSSGIGTVEPTDAELEDALMAANCHHTFFGSRRASSRFPEGWHTRVGDGGSRLSGGERQRVAIARALLKVR